MCVSTGQCSVIGEMFHVSDASKEGGQCTLYRNYVVCMLTDARLTSRQAQAGFLARSLARQLPATLSEQRAGVQLALADRQYS